MVSAVGPAGLPADGDDVGHAPIGRLGGFRKVSGRGFGPVDTVDAHLDFRDFRLDLLVREKAT